jgi:hypothetical protein
MKNIKIVLVMTFGLFLGSCKDYLDVIPDNVATIENAFTLRSTAEKYLFTCYSYLPEDGSIYNPAFTGADEVWIPNPSDLSVSTYGPVIARGEQSKVNPVLSFWDGTSNTKPLFQGLRDCNIFLENIASVPGMEDTEKRNWIAEVKFLKAYYHFYLVRMYGPIPLIKENAPVSASLEVLKIKRDPVDECFDYIVQLIDEAVPDLQESAISVSTDLGRVNKLVALSVKAKVLVTAASPLFNGNTAYSEFKNKDGEQLINTVKDDSKWQRAALACKEAVEACQTAGLKLHYFNNTSQFSLSPATITQMSIRNSVADKANTESIWANTNGLAVGLQRESTPTGLDPSNPTNSNTMGNYAPTLKMAELFYTKNGVPITEDKTWAYNSRYNLRVATTSEKYNLQPGYTTVGLHFDREDRFYADLAFDGGVWFGQGRYDDNNPWVIQAKTGQANSKITSNRYSITGYWTKKLVHYQNIIGNGNSYTLQRYPFPIMRLADLYLLYAEALNESTGPSQEVYDLLNLVRSRAGLPTVQNSWDNFSTQPDKYKNVTGLRNVIQQERLIELAFEGQRFWDLRRWKTAETILNQNIYGWDINQSQAEFYYRPKLLFKQSFTLKDYLWPIKENNIIVNNKLVQNPGW